MSVTVVSSSSSSSSSSSTSSSTGSTSSTSSSSSSSSSTTSTTSTNRVSDGANDMEWFAGVAEDELLYYTGVGANGGDIDSLWAVISSFVPPPPRPPYLPEEDVTTDGLTTCDLCTWALRNDRHSFSLDGTLEAPGEFGWVLTLVIVSLVSAGIGAVVMVTLLQCRRMKSAGGRASCCGIGVEEANVPEPVGTGSGGVAAGGGGVSVIPDRPPLELDKLPPYHDVTPRPGHNVWSWLGSRRGGGTAGVVTTPLTLPQHRCAMNLPVENHYTHMQTDEALYAELDSQTASYASDLQLELRGRGSSSTYGVDDVTTTLPADQDDDDDYHELDAATLHRRYGGGSICDNKSDNGSLKKDNRRNRRSQRLKEPDYEMYENGPTSPIPPSQMGNNGHLHHHHHHHHHHHLHQTSSLRLGNHNNTGNAETTTTTTTTTTTPSYQNTGYTGSDAEPDGPSLSSAPSSAYYSDLSSNSTNNQQTTMLAITLPRSGTSDHHQHQNQLQSQLDGSNQQYRLAAINETATTTSTSSDYI